MNILAYDFETSPIIATTWGLWNQNIQPSNILEDWKLISGAWSWIGDKKIEVISWKKTTDKKVSPFLGFTDIDVVKKFHSLFMEADVILAQNGDSFDRVKWNTRAIQFGLDPLPPKPSIDTLKIAKKYFKFTSNKLDYLGEYLGVGSKMKTSHGLWTKVIQGDSKALKEMCKYNIQDVKLLKDVYAKLLPHIQNHPNYGLHSEKNVCPNCKSSHLQKRGFKYTRTNMYQQYQCMSCKSWHIGKTSLKTTDIR